jgi:hypothetical protein
MPPHPSIQDTRDFVFLRGTKGVECGDLLVLATLAAVCLLLGFVAYWLRMREEWHAVAREKRAGDMGGDDAVQLELEAGRRYNIPVEYLRGMEIRVR